VPMLPGGYDSLAPVTGPAQARAGRPVRAPTVTGTPARGAGPCRAPKHPRIGRDGHPGTRARAVPRTQGSSGIGSDGTWAPGRRGMRREAARAAAPASRRPGRAGHRSRCTTPAVMKICLVVQAPIG
jgi:hypothetical protein